MKKINLLYLLTALFLFYSCDDMLDEDPEYSVNGKTVFESEKTAQMALNGCYGFLCNDNLYGQFRQEAAEAASGVSWAQYNGGEDDHLVSFQALSNNTFTQGMWKGYYDVISECNWFLLNMKSSPLNQEFKNYTMAQAYFLRGLCYFELMHFFGGVPLRTEPTTTSTIAMGRASREEVFQRVVDDWTAALDLKGLKTSEADASVPTVYTVNAYLAKLYFLEASRSGLRTDWEKAKTYGNLVMDKYALESDFANLFVAKPKSAEIIFQLNYSLSTAKTRNRTSWVFAPGSGATGGPTTGVAWGRIRCSRAFYDLFRGTYIGDPRLETTFMTEWKIAKKEEYAVSYPLSARTKKVNGVQVLIKKYEIDYASLADPTNPQRNEIDSFLDSAFVMNKGASQTWPYYNKMIDLNASGQMSNKNMILFRYADLLLLMADVENELGNTDVAIGYVNLVLDRARRSASPASAEPKDWPKGLGQEVVRNKIFFERMFELAGEGQNFFDARRRGTEYLKKVVQVNNRHTLTQEHVKRMNELGITDGWRNRTLPEDENTLKKALLFPIPFNEIKSNDMITEKDQNFGYN